MTDLYFRNIALNHWILHLKQVNFTMYKLYLNKAKTKNASGGLEEDGLEGVRLEGTVAEV